MNASTKWIVAIVGLLGGNLLAMAILIGAARTGQSRVIPAYYEKATHYNDAIDQAARNRALGWSVAPRWTGHDFVADVVDARGTRILDAKVDIAAVSRSGKGRGLTDLTITVTRGGDVFVDHALVEVP